MDSDRQKAMHGSIATIVWLLGSAYLFISTTGFSSIFGWKAISFILIGMFVSAVIVGNITYRIQLLVAGLLANSIGPNGPTANFTSAVKLLGLVLFAFDIYVAWFAVSRGFAYFFGSGV